MKRKPTRMGKVSILFLLLTILYMPLQARYGTMSFPTCQPAPNPCYNLICNGGFEVHDTTLDGSTWVSASGVGVEFWKGANGESDIQGWSRSALKNTSNPFPQHTTPDIFVQNGYGLTMQSTSPFPTAFGTTMAGIVTSEAGGPFYPQPASYDWKEGIMTDLLSPIIPGYPYQLSFKAYTINVPGLNGTPPQTYTPYKTQYVDIILTKNGGVDSLFITTAVLIHESIAGGWYSYSHSFTLPDSTNYYGFDQIMMTME